MNIVLVPGFMGFPEDGTIRDLAPLLVAKGHTVTKVAWPYFPDDLSKYSLSATLVYTRQLIHDLPSDDLAIIGFSMGGIIATVLAAEFKSKKLALVVSPYHVGSEQDIAGKYQSWKAMGYRDIVSSKYGALRVPFSFVEDAQQYNALDYISSVHCSVLCIAAEADEKNPLAVTKKLFDAANEPKTWLQIPGMQHKYHYQPEMLEKVNDVLVDFIG